ncbi:hypothetical protein [Marinilactibacillus kalidii]|uniref:hypothetical protein n=1 Tax=Marinilactibacillus kalidii TaxID=2820274 RepID=UPI001ABE23A4|nr:hypothetical protein [Marinilactibacillus kalidii]
MSAIPEGFSTLMLKQYGSEATEWVETLPERLTACAAFFKLRELKPFEQLTYNYVAEGITNQESVVLKMLFEKASLKKEKEVLEAFVDKGVIRVLGYSEPLGGLILEKVTPGRPLTEIGNDEKDGWKVIDPKGIIGDIHFETIQYLLNYVDRNGDPDAVLK